MFHRLARDESGIALVLAVITMGVLASLTATVVFAVTVNHRGARSSASAQRAFALAQSGLAQAEGLLYASTNPNDSTDVPATGPVSLDGGTYTYSGTLSGSTWTLTATGTVNGVSRTVSARAIAPAPVVTNDPTIWNFIYANSSSTCTTIGGSVTINVPLYTQGGFCLNGSARYTGSDLEVGGNVSVTGSAQIGTSTSNRIAKMNVGGTCSPAPCNGSSSPIWVNSPGVGNTITPVLTMPSVNLGGTYASTNPGPAAGHACAAGSTGVPANFFDNDNTQNNSDGNINLFPASNYDCKNASGTSVLTWDAAAKTLLVNGTFYFDGSLSQSGSQHVVYSGLGTLYFTGTVSLTGSIQICGITNCTASWDTTNNVLVMVAGCWADTTGATLVRYATSSTYCVDIGGSSSSNKVQIPFYLTTDYHLGGSAQNMGPAIADTVTLAGSSTTQLPLHALPSGAPTTVNTTYPPALAATNWSG